MIAVVALIAGHLYFTTCKITDTTWEQLLLLKDEQIQFAELAGTVLTWYTFKDRLAGSLWTCFMDNQAVERCLRARVVPQRPTWRSGGFG